MSTAEDSALYLALDQGGHACRVLVFDGSGTCIAAAEQPFPTRRTADERVEQDGKTLAQAMEQALARVAEMLGPRVVDVAAGGLATQRSSIICVEKGSGRALTPVISWEDRRAARWLEALAPDAQLVRRLTGLQVSAHYGAGKMRWCLDNEPAVAAAAARGDLVLAPLACFLAHRLARREGYVVDPCNASRTLLWDLHSGDWSPVLLDLFGIPRSALPESVANRFEFGALRLGRMEVPLSVVTGDQSAVPFAGGMPDRDTAYVNTGTGAFVQRLAEKETQPGRLLHSVVWMDGDRSLFMDEGTVNGAGSAIAGECRHSGRSEAEVFAALDGWLAEVTDPPLFLNGVSGLGSPWWLPRFESRFIGDGNAAARFVAVAESIVFLIFRNLQQLSGRESFPQRIVMTGGLARLDGLCRRLAALAGCEVWRPGHAEATARGLAWLTAGCPSHWPAGETARFRPERSPVADRYARWLREIERAIAS